MKIIAVTMVYNEGERLAAWLAHYGRQLGRDSLLVIDHGSNDGSTDEILASKILLPRSEFDDIQRAEFVSDLSQSLLRYYDAMIYVDCDEMIVADPQYYPSLRSFLEASSGATSIRPVGLDLFHVIDQEPPIDLSKPILAQRQHCWFRSALCKPSIIFKPVRWVAGFHHCSERATADTRLFLFHTKQIDHSLSLRRLALTRSMEWSQRSLAGGMGQHQRWTDDELTRAAFQGPRQMAANQGVSDFSELAFSNETTKLNNELALVHGIYRCSPYSGAIYRVPERFWQIF